MTLKFTESKTLKKHIELYNRFMDSKPKKKHLFGATALCEEVVKLFEVNSIVDDVIEKDEIFGCRVTRSTDLTQDDIVLNCVSLGRPITVQKTLDALGIPNLSYLSFKYIHEEMKKNQIFPM